MVFLIFNLKSENRTVESNVSWRMHQGLKNDCRFSIKKSLRFAVKEPQSFLFYGSGAKRLVSIPSARKTQVRKNETIIRDTTKQVKIYHLSKEFEVQHFPAKQPR